MITIIMLVVIFIRRRIKLMMVIATIIRITMKIITIIMLILTLRASRRPGPRVHRSLLKRF